MSAELVHGLPTANDFVLELRDSPLVALDLTNGSLDDGAAKRWAARAPARKLAVLRVTGTHLAKRGRDALAAEQVIA